MGRLAVGLRGGITKTRRQRIHNSFTNLSLSREFPTFFPRTLEFYLNFPLFFRCRRHRTRKLPHTPLPPSLSFLKALICFSCIRRRHWTKSAPASCSPQSSKHSFCLYMYAVCFFRRSTPVLVLVMPHHPSPFKASTNSGNRGMTRW